MIGIRILRICDQVFAQCLICEDIDAHRRKIALGMCRLLFKFNNHIVLIGIHNTETCCFLKGYFTYSDGCVRIHLLVVCQHLVVIHLVDVVAGQNQHVFRIDVIQEIDVCGNRICCSAIDFKICVVAFPWCQYVNSAVIGIKTPVMISCDIGVQ